MKLLNLDVIFELNAKGVMDALNGGKLDNSKFGVINLLYHIASDC